jgi:hypothetical protein
VPIPEITAPLRILLSAIACSIFSSNILPGSNPITKILLPALQGNTFILTSFTSLPFYPVSNPDLDIFVCGAFYPVHVILWQ